MKQHGFELDIAELVEAAAQQTEITHHRLALEWGQMVFTHAVQLWNDIEAHETLAYEDKVAAQVHMLDEATSSLRRLHKCWPIPAACFNSIGGFYSSKCRPSTSPDGKTRSPSSSTAHGEWAGRSSAWHGRCFGELSRAA